MATTAEINAMMDEDALHELMKKTEDFNLRREIRQRMKVLREEKSAAWEKTRAERDACQTDVIAMRQRQAQEQKEKEMKRLDEKAKEKREKATPSVRDEMIKQKHEAAKKEKEEKMKQMAEMNQMMNQFRGQGQQKEISETQRIAEEQKSKKMASTANESTTSHKTETDKDGTKTTTTTTTSTKKNAGDSQNAFKQLDAGSGGSPVTVQRSPSGIKQALLEWCKRMTVGYEHVNITNFSSSWNDGMAFCALIHHFYPRAFNYAKLNPKCRRGNFKLAFEVAEKLGGIAPLLEVDDMVRMKNPDWKCVFTYVQQYYGRFRNWEQEQAEKAAKAAEGGAAQA